MNKYEEIILRHQLTTRIQQLTNEIANPNLNNTGGANNAIVEEQEEKDIIEVEFENIIGLQNIKKELKSFQNYLKMQKERERRGFITSSIPLHAVFSGSPGTGKTTVARILGKVYKELNILKKGHVVEVDRCDLVAGYIGQTTLKTKEVLNEALDGILFIDEAYSLTKGETDERDFGKEAVETILKFMEDNRSRISIIVAGYQNNMEKFINSNPGLKSRFGRIFTFADFTPDELSKIFTINADKENYKIRDHAFEYLKYFIHEFKRLSDPKSFGNGRTIRDMFENLKLIQSDRVSSIWDIKEVSDMVIEYFTLRDVKELFYKFEIPLPNADSLAQA